MKRIDILVCLELFNIRKQKCYPKQVIKDSYITVKDLCSRKNLSNYSGLFYDPIKTYSEFKNQLRSIYLQKSPLEFRYCTELLDYMDTFETFIVDNIDLF